MSEEAHTKRFAMVGVAWGSYLALTFRKNLGVLVTYMMLKAFNNPKHPGSCYPPLKEVAALTPFEVRTVRRHVRKLEAAGAVLIQARPGKSSIYRFPAEPPDDAVSATPPAGPGEVAGTDSQARTPKASSPPDTPGVRTTPDNDGVRPPRTPKVSAQNRPSTDHVTDHHQSAESQPPRQVPEGLPDFTPKVVVEFVEGQSRKRQEAFGKRVREAEPAAAKAALEELGQQLESGTEIANVVRYFETLLANEVVIAPAELLDEAERAVQRGNGADGERAGIRQDPDYTVLMLAGQDGAIAESFKREHPRYAELDCLSDLPREFKRWQKRRSGAGKSPQSRAPGASDPVLEALVPEAQRAGDRGGGSHSSASRQQGQY